MASWTVSRLQDPGYRRFILAGLTLDWLCVQLEPYLVHVIKDLHADLLKNGHTKPVCHNNSNTYKEVRVCPWLSCGSSVKLLDGYHITGSIRLGWKNSQLERWETQPWALALLFMNPGQDPVTNTKPTHNDITGIVNLMLHCTWFKMNRTLVENIRDHRNSLIHHSPTFKVTEAVFNDIIDGIEKLLLDPCVASHVKGNVVQYLNDVKQLKLDITFHDEITVMQNMWSTMEERQTKSLTEFITTVTQQMSSTMEERQTKLLTEFMTTVTQQISSTIEEGQAKSRTELMTKQEDLLKALTEFLQKQQTQHVQIPAVLQNTDDHAAGTSQVKVVQTHTAITCPHTINVEGKQTTAFDNSSKRMKAITQDTDTDNIVQSLKQKLVKCYSGPEFNQLSPLLDDDTFGHFIESVYVEVTLRQRHIKPIIGKSGLEDSIRQKGTPIQNASEMIPPPDGQRILLTGFVGSGKTSLCLFWLNKWSSGGCASSDVHGELNNYELVIFLRARALEKNIHHSVANMLYGEQDEVSHINTNKIKDALLSNPSTLIIVDGYDETTKEQKKIIQNLVSCELLTASVIITSRPNFFHGKASRWFENLGFNHEQQLHFIDKFKCTVLAEHIEHFENFQKDFVDNKNATNIFTSPMMAMTTCTIVAEGEKVDLTSRVKNYQQVTDFLSRRAFFKSKGLITTDMVSKSIPAISQAAFSKLLDHNAFNFSRCELLTYMCPEELDNVIVHLGYLAVTKYILCGKIEFAYTFIHKSWAEFAAARHVMSLPIADRCTAVNQLFKSGPANLEVLRFALGLCSLHEPGHTASLFRAVGEVVRKLDMDDDALRQQMEENKTTETTVGSCYLLLVLTDVDPSTLPAAALWELSRVCVAVWSEKIEEGSVNQFIPGKIEVSDADKRSARSLYAGLLLTTHRAQGSLHTVRQVEVRCDSDSPHSTVTCLPTTLAACTPSMIALTNVKVMELASATELGSICEGLAASGAPRLTSLVLGGAGNLKRVAGVDLGPLVRVVRAAAQLTELDLSLIHLGEEELLLALCDALGKAAPQLTRLELYECSVTSQLYSAVLLPALRGRLASGGVRLREVKLMYEEDSVGGNWSGLQIELQEVAETVTVCTELGEFVGDFMDDF